MKQIQNFTPHDINYYNDCVENPITVYKAFGGVARVEQAYCWRGLDFNWVDEDCPVRLVRSTYGDVTGLPAEDGKTLFIVSAMVRLALPERHDLISPAMLVRDEFGHIIGCRAFESN
jgi:hypothetical protein